MNLPHYPKEGESIPQPKKRTHPWRAFNPGSLARSDRTDQRVMKGSRQRNRAQ